MASVKYYTYFWKIDFIKSFQKRNIEKPRNYIMKKLTKSNHFAISVSKIYNIWHLAIKQIW